MAEPVNVADDLAVTRYGIVRDLQLKVYAPATDAHAAATDCRGFRGEKRVESVGVGDSGAVVRTVSDWTLIDLLTRPLQRSLIVDPDTSEEWAIDTVHEHEPDDGVWDCQATLQPTDA